MRYLSFLIVLSSFYLSACATKQHDVVIYGGTSAGVAAAVQAARMNQRVVLIEPTMHVGGLSSSGLGFTDSGNAGAIGGVAREFYEGLYDHYAEGSAWKWQDRAEFTRLRGQGSAAVHEETRTAWIFEPSAAEKVFEKMLAEHRIEVVRGRRLDRRHGVRKDGERIVSITMTGGETYRGRMFIDATYEGDLMAAAGVSYFVGREPNSLYGETLNGMQYERAVHHQFVKPVDPYVTPGDPSSGMLPGVNQRQGMDGDGDQRMQAYNFRMCMTDVPENRVPFTKPGDYNEREYELLLRNFEAGDMRIPLKIDRMPNGKTDLNNNFAVSTDFIGRNYDYPEANDRHRQAIYDAHRTYIQGLLWTLQNHPRVPEEVRRRVAPWGLAKDEFTDNGHWPYIMYIREARRMVSDYVLTEHDCVWTKRAEDGVALGAYTMDSHHTQRYVTAEGHVRNEGDVQVRIKGPYPISYRSIVPARGECENLLVAVAISASHIAYGSARMEPVFMALGQSAATAAAHAIEEGVMVQDVDYSRLRERLIADGQIVDWPTE